VTAAARFLARSSLEVGGDLIGCELLVDGVGGRIVECEAYARDDPASHAFPGPTRRNASMFGPAGRIYVYRSYGIHWMLNIVCGAQEGAGEAVLIRALEPTAGIEVMRERRGREPLLELCRGPGRLGQALAIGPELDGKAVVVNPDSQGLALPVRAGPGLSGSVPACPGQTPPVRIELRIGAAPGPVIQTPRIGISRAVEQPWRFALEGSPYVSPYRRSRSA
jgi:DNA-3-methyladenine glycosylase